MYRERGTALRHSSRGTHGPCVDWSQDALAQPIAHLSATRPLSTNRWFVMPEMHMWHAELNRLQVPGRVCRLPQSGSGGCQQLNLRVIPGRQILCVPYAHSSGFLHCAPTDRGPQAGGGTYLPDTTRPLTVRSSQMLPFFHSIGPSIGTCSAKRWPIMSSMTSPWEHSTTDSS